MQNHEINDKSILDAYAQCILLKQMHTYSGKRYIKYLAQTVYRSDDDGTAATADGMFANTREERLGLWTRFTQWSFLSRDSPGGLPVFKHLDPPRRLYTIEDVQDFRPILTKNTWGLERLYCRPSNSRYVAIVRGPGALTPDQVKSSVACAFIALILWLLILTSILSWLDSGNLSIILAAALYLVLACPLIKDNFRLMKVMGQVRNEVLPDDQSENQPETSQQSSNDHLASAIMESEISPAPNQGIYLVKEYERVTQVTDRFCWSDYDGFGACSLLCLPCNNVVFDGEQLDSGFVLDCCFNLSSPILCAFSRCHRRDWKHEHQAWLDSRGKMGEPVAAKWCDPSNLIRQK
jgi:hypothetical protein